MEVCTYMFIIDSWTVFFIACYNYITIIISLVYS